MATRIVKICDGCDKEEPIEEGPFGVNAQPKGWLAVTAWDSPETQPALACSWSCLATVGKAREKAAAQSDPKD